MNKTMATAARSMTICLAAILGFNAADAADAGLSSDRSTKDGSLKYTVRFPDLDLSKIEGAAALYARLDHAASVVCAPLESLHRWRAAEYRACTGRAIADAVASVNRPLLSQYHELRTKGDRSGLVQLAKADSH